MKILMLGYKYISLSLLFLFFALTITYGQEGSGNAKYNRAEKVYTNLEYNTLAFNDLKPIWNVTDPGFIREIFNKFIVHKALKIDGKDAGMAVINKNIDDIYEGKVFLEVRKRYYDDEIEMMRFYREIPLAGDSTKKEYFFDPIDDHIYIKSILGDKIYQSLKDKFYAHHDLTKTEFNSRIAYNFDIYFHLFKPELLFYSLSTSPQNKYLLSFLGSWGSNNLVLPGWYAPDYYLGLKFRYLDAQVYNKPYSTYYVEAGIGMPVRQPNTDFIEDQYGQRLYRSGLNFRVKAGGRPFKYMHPELDKLEISVESMFTVTKLTPDEYGVDYITKFNSIRSYYILDIDYESIFEIGGLGYFNAGLGGGMHDHFVYLLDPGLEILDPVEPKENKFFGFADVSLSNFGGLLYYHVGPQFNYNFSDEVGYIGLKTKFLISNTFGLEFNYFKAVRIGGNALPFYRYDNYFVITPILRINY